MQPHKRGGCPRRYGWSTMIWVGSSPSVKDRDLVELLHIILAEEMDTEGRWQKRRRFWKPDFYWVGGVEGCGMAEESLKKKKRSILGDLGLFWAKSTRRKGWERDRACAWDLRASRSPGCGISKWHNLHDQQPLVVRATSSPIWFHPALNAPDARFATRMVSNEERVGSKPWQSTPTVPTLRISSHYRESCSTQTEDPQKGWFAKET